MKIFSYVVSRDFGFAPNPFNGFCTLATCKPDIRSHALVGDWILGTGSVKLKCRYRLIYAMRVTEKMTFNEYWSDARFSVKRPVMNGSLKTMYGDNIYHMVDEDWYQANSHHSLEDGSVNMKNLTKDTRSDSVLISDIFYYFGSNNIEIPPKLVALLCKSGRAHRYADPVAFASLLDILNRHFEPGYNGDPIQFTKFCRYKGE